MAEVIESYPLTPTQQGILFNSLRASGRLVEIEQIVCRLGHELDVARLRACWEWASERHAALRTSFRWSDGEPAQDVHARAPMPWSERDRSALSASERDDELARFLEEDRERGFDLSRAPLARLTLFRHGPREHVLVWTFHHALLDGRSFTAVLREVLERYDGASVAPHAPPAFRLHCEHVAARDVGPERAFWSEQLRGFVPPTPLPAARSAREPRPPGATRRPRRHDEIESRVGADAVARLVEIGRERGFTLANAVQGAWAILLARYGRVEDVCFGSTRAARHGTVPGALDMVGCLINTVPLRVAVRPDDSLASFLGGLRELSLAIRPHEQASLASMRGWSTGGTSTGAATTGAGATGAGGADTPLFETLVVFERYLMDSELRALASRPGAEAWSERRFSVLEQSDFPLVLAAYQDDGDLLLKIEHDPARCDPDAIARLAGHLRALLRAMAERPDALLRELSMIDGRERAELLARAGGDGPLLDTTARSWVEAFRARVAERPDAVALVHEQGELTYAALDRDARAIEGCLAERGVRPGDVVAVCVRRSPLLASALIGVLRAGAVYLPIDPTWPRERVALLLEDARAGCVIAQRGTAHVLAAEALERALLVDDRPAPSRARRDPSAGGRPEPSGGPAIDPESPAYLLYTSGSTGRPKGVLVPHRALFAHARAIVPAYALEPRDRCLQFTSPSFDVSLEEMLPTWLAGATVVLRSDAAAHSIEAFLRELERQRITVINVPSAFFTEVALHASERRVSSPPCVRLVVVGGERPSALAYAAWRRRHPHVRFLDAYGPTEVTITCTYCDPAAAGVPADGQTEIPIGRPLGATRAYVLDEHGDLAPLGVPGELCLAGPQVALGYLGRDDLSHRQFVPDPFAGSGPMYRSGDLARWLLSGELELLGRIDDQVKIRGFRIEPGEIESALRACRGVRDAVVAARPSPGSDPGGSRELVAWVVARDGDRALCTPSALRDALAKQLPAYMVPSAFALIDALPLTPGGKVDKRALPAPDRDEIGRRFVPPEGDLETWLAGLFCEILGKDEIGADESFFDLGGHSLSAVRLLSRINAGAREPIDLGTIFARPTVSDLARALGTGSTVRVPTLVPLNRAEGSSVPFFCICGVHLYARLARAMEADRRVHGAFLPIEASALEGDRWQSTLDVRSMAAAYIDLVREHHPRGPYLLGGLSFGGILAFEMAQQLRAQGEPVPLLVLFDAILPRALHRLSIAERARVHLRRLAIDPRAVVDHFSDRVRRHVTRLGALRGTPLARDDRGAIASFDLLRDELFRRAADDYDRAVRPYDGQVVIFRSRDGIGSETQRVDPDRGWSDLVPVGTRVHEVPGTHLQILQEPGVFEIARVLRAELRQLDDRSPPVLHAGRTSTGRLARTAGGRTSTDI